MSAEYFLDTNIFVSSFDAGAPAKARRSEELIRTAVTTGKGVISHQVVQEFFNVALRRFSRPMTPGDAEQYMTAVFRPLLAIHSSQALYSEALRLVDRHKLGWYDSLLVAAAIESGCATLYSEDLPHGMVIGQLRIVNPFLS